MNTRTYSELTEGGGAGIFCSLTPDFNTENTTNNTLHHNHSTNQHNKQNHMVNDNRHHIAMLDDVQQPLLVNLSISILVSLSRNTHTHAYITHTFFLHLSIFHRIPQQIALCSPVSGFD